jgi:hypothetical protein
MVDAAVKEAFVALGHGVIRGVCVGFGREASLARARTPGTINPPEGYTSADGGHGRDHALSTMRGVPFLVSPLIARALARQS